MVRSHIKVECTTCKTVETCREDVYSRYDQLFSVCSRYDKLIRDILQIYILLFKFINFIHGIKSDRVCMKDLCNYLRLFTSKAERTSIRVYFHLMWYAMRLSAKHSSSLAECRESRAESIEIHSVSLT